MDQMSKVLKRALAVIFFACSLVALTPVPAAAQNEPDPAQELADRYAPIMMIKAQDEPCDADGEPYAPTAVDIILDNPEVVLRQVGNGDPVVAIAPSGADIHGLGEGFYLDFPGSALDPACVYETDFEKYRDGRRAVIYAHIVQQADTPDRLALQYWFYWYYNDWNNKHESDWEGIQLLFEASSIDEALAGAPISVGYAQHEGGERADWDSPKLRREGSRPLVYSSAGSHASYFSSAVYLGRGASEGFGCDTTDGPSERLDPEVVVLPSSVDDPSSPLAWLAFDGRWGERQPGPFNGPTGPTTKERWTDPIDWHDELRNSSVVIPAGDSEGASIITRFCSVVESGSGALILFSTSPTMVLFAIAVVALLVRWLVRRTVWDRVEPLPIVHRRRAGQLLRAAGELFRRSPAVWAFGLVYLPAALVVGVVVGIIASLPLLRELLDLAGSDSGSGLLFAVALGSFFNLAAFVAVNATVAAHFTASDLDDQPRPREAVRAVWERRASLLSGFLVSYVLVTLLILTIIGIPVAIYLTVRFQFMAHAVMVEGVAGGAGLRRSMDLTRGRWWHTALMTSLINAAVASSGVILGLLVLVVFTSLPIWAFSAVITAMYALIAPVTAIAQTLLYGDAAAEHLAPADIPVASMSDG